MVVGAAGRCSSIGPCVVGADRERVAGGLDEVAAGEPVGSVIRGTRHRRARPCSSSPAKAPNGSAWEWDCTPHFPVFAEAFNTVVGELDRHLLRPLREVMWGHDEDLLEHNGIRAAGVVRGRGRAVPVAGVLGRASPIS